MHIEVHQKCLGVEGAGSGAIAMRGTHPRESEGIRYTAQTKSNKSGHITAIVSQAGTKCADLRLDAGSNAGQS